MKASTQRNFVRSMHIIVGSIIATYIYSPWSSIPAFQVFTRWIVLPLLILSGLWMWKGHLLRQTKKPAPAAG